MSEENECESMETSVGLNGIQHDCIKEKNTRLFFLHSATRTQMHFYLCVRLWFIIVGAYHFQMTLFSPVSSLEWLYSFVHGSSREPH